MTDGLCLYGDLNEVACDKCAERDRACEKREGGSVGCKRCQYSKLGCSLINRKKKSTRTPKTPKTPKQDSVQELDGEMLVVGEWPRMLVEIVGECMAPLVDQLAESKKANAEMAGIRSEVSRMANAMEDIASLLREKWSGKDLEVVGEVGTSADKGKGVAAVPEESGSSEDSDEEDKDDEDKADEDDEDVDMDEDGSVGGAGPIGIIGDPVAGPSSSAVA